MNDDLRLYLRIAKKHYLVMEKYTTTLPFFQIDYEKFRNFSVNLNKKDDDMVYQRVSSLKSWWEQVYSQYFFIKKCLREALGYYDISESEEKNRMLSNFTYCAEHFIFRIFALLEKIAQLSNIYHNLNLNANSLTFNKVKNIWDKNLVNNLCNLSFSASEIISGNYCILHCVINSFPNITIFGDKFIESVMKFFLLKSVSQLIVIRQNLTHKYELDVIGTGYPHVHKCEFTTFRINFDETIRNVPLEDNELKIIENYKNDRFNSRKEFADIMRLNNFEEKKIKKLNKHLKEILNKGISYGGYKQNDVTKELLREYIIDAFNNLTTMLKEIDYLLEREWLKVKQPIL